MMEKYKYLETQTFLYNYIGLVIKKHEDVDEKEGSLFYGFTAYLIKHRKGWDKPLNELEEVFSMERGTNTNNALVAILERYFKDAIKDFAEHKHKTGYEPLEFFNRKTYKFQKNFTKPCDILINPIFSSLSFRYLFANLGIEMITVLNTPEEKIIYFTKHN